MSHRPRLISIATGALALVGMLLLWPAGPALAAITFKTSNTASATASSLTITKPTTVVAGDFLVTQLFFIGNRTITAPTLGGNWTLLLRTNLPGDLGQAIYYKFAGASEPTSYSWGVTSSGDVTGGILVYTGVDTTNPIVVQAGPPATNGSGNTGDSSTLTANSINAVANSKLLAFFGIKKKDITLALQGSPPSNLMTQRYSFVPTARDAAILAADQDVGAGATDDRVATSTSGDKWVAQLVALRSAPLPALQVSKTATPTFTRTFDWTIDKSVTPDSWDLFTGDSGTSDYTLTLTKLDGVDSAWAVSGTITIANPNSVAATITNVTDSVGGVNAPIIDCTIGGVSQGGTSFSLPGTQTALCEYSSGTNLTDGTTRQNVATVTTSGEVPGASSAEVEVAFVTPTTLVNDEVSVTDVEDGTDVERNFGPFSTSSSPTYEREFTCDADEGTPGNTATIDEISTASDTATVEVNCYELEVAKTVDPEFTRTWTWGIEKESDGNAVHNPLVLAAGQQYEVNYTVTVDAEGADSEHKITGTITITNPSPRAATLTAVTDAANDANDTGDNALCPNLSVPAEGTLECTYELNLGDDGTATLNTATATLQNVDYDSEGNGTESGTTDFEGTEPVSFDDPTNEVDECANVSDSEDTDALPNDSCATEDPHEEPFNYARFIGPYLDPEQCGDQEALNTASFVTNDTETEDSANHTVFVNVTCEDGGGSNGTCTLSQGYWKTHSAQGPAPYDENWANLGDADGDTAEEEEGENFFYSSQTYRQVLWTPPAGGNAYYILAKQYIAAELNALNGSDLTGIDLAFTQATALFNTPQNTPTYIRGLKSNNALRQQFLDLAGILGAFNEDNHCDEDETSAP